MIWGIFLFWSLQSSLNLKALNKYWLLSFICILGFATSLVALFNPVISLRLPAGSLIYSALSNIPSASELAKINPNEIGGILAWCIPISFGFAIAFFQQNSSLKFDNKNQRYFLMTLFLAPLLPMMTVLFLASSRSALGGVILASGLIIWLMNENGRSKIILSGVGILALSLLVILFLDESSGLQPVLVDLVEPFTGESDNDVSGNTTLSVRAEIWSRALDGIYDFPVTGMGINTFREVVHTVYPMFLVPQDVDIAHAHNQFLQVALDLGIPGLIFYVGILMLTFVFLVKCWSFSHHDENHKMAVAGVAGAFLASLVYGLADAIALGAVPSFVFWLLLAVTAALYKDKATYSRA
ncbi:MAG: O-antigen ligase family protein [Anaerolineae bacterium]